MPFQVRHISNLFQFPNSNIMQLNINIANFYNLTYNIISHHCSTTINTMELNKVTLKLTHMKDTTRVYNLFTFFFTICCNAHSGRLITFYF